ncbi:hypothetical protein [Thomasclavelia saccharogumia]|uniref:hypothetical protein n=1 Tax=Thomasclavelia saccharogumia TaxID=341225 RepID=UPI00047BA4C5|nr:hypothetical protein [Thomasclavelia saccharogumia]
MKQIKIILVINILFSLVFINTDTVFANEKNTTQPTAVIYCERYKGKHRAVNQGQCNIFSTKNESRSMYNWGYYRCACGTVLFCSGRPDADGYKAGIPEYYIESSDDRRGKDWEVYEQSFGYILKTDLPITYKNTPMISYNFS